MPWSSRPVRNPWESSAHGLLDTLAARSTAAELLIESHLRPRKGLPGLGDGPLGLALAVLSLVPGLQLQFRWAQADEDLDTRLRPAIFGPPRPLCSLRSGRTSGSRTPHQERFIFTSPISCVSSTCEGLEEASAALDPQSHRRLVHEPRAAPRDSQPARRLLCHAGEQGIQLLQRTARPLPRHGQLNEAGGPAAHGPTCERAPRPWPRRPTRSSSATGRNLGRGTRRSQRPTVRCAGHFGPPGAQKASKARPRSSPDSGAWLFGARTGVASASKPSASLCRSH